MAEPRLRQLLDTCYNGRTRRAAAFRYALIVFDISTIVFFIATAPLPSAPWILAVDLVLGCLILADFLARLWIAQSKRKMLLRIYTLADIAVILSLILAPLISQNFAFLRVLRTLRLLHSYHVLRDLRRESFFRRHEEVIVNAVHLAVFIFLMTAMVFVLQFGGNPDVESYVDALYLTVATLTTTGFGDIVLTGTEGRLLAVFIMVVGVALFFRLAQAIFRPQKVQYDCPECGLSRHETDAVHCKHCGEPIKIETEGEG